MMILFSSQHINICICVCMNVHKCIIVFVHITHIDACLWNFMDAQVNAKIHVLRGAIDGLTDILDEHTYGRTNKRIYRGHFAPQTHYSNPYPQPYSLFSMSPRSMSVCLKQSMVRNFQPSIVELHMRVYCMRYTH